VPYNPGTWLPTWPQRSPFTLGLLLGHNLPGNRGIWIGDFL